MESPQAILHAFMQDMNAWEQRSANRTELCIAGMMDFSEADELIASEYAEIFRKWCSVTRGKPRDGMCYSVPPDYDPEGETIVEIRENPPDLVEIETQQNYLHRKRQVYGLVLENGQWRLYEKKVVLHNGELLEFLL